jgi:hypothetical protein
LLKYINFREFKKEYKPVAATFSYII